MDMQQVSLIGNLTRDPEMRYSPRGNAYTRFTLACNGKVRSKNGSTEDKASFYSCVVFGKLADIVNQYAVKGDKMFVQGTLDADIWQDNSGNARVSLDVNAQQAVLLGNKADRGKPYGVDGVDGGDPPISEAEIPF